MAYIVASQAATEKGMPINCTDEPKVECPNKADDEAVTEEDAKRAVASALKKREAVADAMEEQFCLRGLFTVRGAVSSVVEYKERTSITIELGGTRGATLTDIAEGKWKNPESTFARTVGTFVEPVPHGTIAETRQGVKNEIMAFSVLTAVNGMDVSGMPHQEVVECIMESAFNETRSEANEHFSLTFQKPLWLTWWKHHAKLTDEQEYRLYHFCRCFTNRDGLAVDHVEHREEQMVQEYGMVEMTEEQLCDVMEALHTAIQKAGKNGQDKAAGKAYFLIAFPHDVGFGPIWFPGPCRRRGFGERTNKAIADAMETLKGHGMG